MEIGYNNKRTEECYREVSSATASFRPQTVMGWNKEGEIISNKEKVM
jgi:hypothetical protein